MSTKHDRPEVREPARATQRAANLPWRQPISPADDPQAPARPERIFASPSAVQAGQDPAFLNRDDTRGVRLRVDAFKPRLLLREDDHDIGKSIAVLSARGLSRPVASRHSIATSAGPSIPVGPTHLQSSETHAWRGSIA